MPEVFSRWGATEFSGEAVKASRTARSDAPRRWRARRPLASRVVMDMIFSEIVVGNFSNAIADLDAL